MLKVIELFAGVGSQTESLKEIGLNHEVIAISENDKYASRAYELLHGKVNNLGDIKKIDEFSNTQLYKMAGNGIVINLLNAMFKKLKEQI